ncbi:MAG: DUF11 domain-containing protein [Methanobrevibacter sp.]|nr:DUF11 domain-containing protein [Methanobrevibacter sp.]
MALLSLSCVNAENIGNSTGELQSTPNTNPVTQNTSNTASFLVLDNDADKENIKIGKVVTWEVSVINLGNETAKGVTVYNQLPEGLSYVSHTTTKGTFNPKTEIWDIGDLSVNDGEVFLYIKTKAITVGEKINKANLTCTSINLNENESYEEEEIDVEYYPPAKPVNFLKSTYKAGNPLSLILLSLFGIFITFFAKSKK